MPCHLANRPWRPCRNRTELGQSVASDGVEYQPGAAEETGRVERPGPWSGGLANRCAKPTCASSPWRMGRGLNSQRRFRRATGFEPVGPANVPTHPVEERPLADCSARAWSDHGCLARGPLLCARRRNRTCSSPPCRGGAFPSGPARVLYQEAVSIRPRSAYEAVLRAGAPGVAPPRGFEPCLSG